MKICKIKDCDNKCFCKELCQKCYMKQYQKNNKKHLSKYMKRHNKQYYKKHKKSKIKYNKQYYKNNEKYFAKQSKQYRQEHRTEIVEYKKQWEQSIIGKASRKAYNHNRRALTKDLTGKIVQKVYKDNLAKHGGVLTCCLCNKPIVNNDDSLEHLTPLTRKGSNDYDNLGVAHKSCNREKQTMTLEEWFNK